MRSTELTTGGCTGRGWTGPLLAAVTGGGRSRRASTGTSCHLIAARRGAPQLHAAVPLEVVEPGEPALFVFRRDHPIGPLVAVSNFADAPRTIAPDLLPPASTGRLIDLLDRSAHPAGEPVEVPPRGVRWLVASDATTVTAAAEALGR